EEEKEETAPTQEEERAGYVPQLEGAELKLGESSKIPLVLSSLPDGLRLAEFRIVSSGGVTFDRVIVLNPSYSVVVEKTDRLISVRVGDFDDEISPGTGELKIAEVGINAVKVGETKLRTRFVGWGDEGSKVTRQGEPAIVAVTLGKVGKSQNPPKDLDGDGLYEDVNGDGKLTQEDAFTLAFNLQSESIQHSASLFDFNWDGKVSFADAAELIHMISG
ncbi:MAG: dockerin type I domain-containing protein, partial [Candidatus Acetothermia bacterium]